MLLRSMKGVGPALWGAAPAPQRPWGHVLGQGAQPSTHSSPGGDTRGWGRSRRLGRHRLPALVPSAKGPGPAAPLGSEGTSLGPGAPTRQKCSGPDRWSRTAGSRGCGRWARGRAGSPSPPGSTRRRLKGSEHQAADTQVIHNVLFKSSPSLRLAGAAASSCAGPWALDAAPAGPGAGSAPSLTRNHRAASRRAPTRAHITASMCRILRASEIWTLVSI